MYTILTIRSAEVDRDVGSLYGLPDLNRYLSMDCGNRGKVQLFLDISKSRNSKRDLEVGRASDVARIEFHRLHIKLSHTCKQDQGHARVQVCTGRERSVLKFYSRIAGCIMAPPAFVSLQPHAVAKLVALL
jgi:hypothetical protein